MNKLLTLGTVLLMTTAANATVETISCHADLVAKLQVWDTTGVGPVAEGQTAMLELKVYMGEAELAAFDNYGGKGEIVETKIGHTRLVYAKNARGEELKLLKFEKDIDTAQTVPGKLWLTTPEVDQFQDQDLECDNLNVR